MRVALVHDYLAQDGGAERVLKAFHEIWPEAPIFVLFHDAEKINYLPTTQIHESVLGRLPFVKKIFPWYLPWMAVATERHHLSGFDVIISSSSAFAKGIITPPESLHISYCHTPARFLWAESHEYLSDLKRSGLVKLLLPNLLHRLRLWDQMNTGRVDKLVANSQTVRRRIWKYYRRDSEVINPPVETDLFTVNANKDDYYVAGGRLVPYKRLDLAIAAFNRLQRPLKIFGTGPELERLQKMSKPNIEFLGKITENKKAELLGGARAFIHPQYEDFGITPLEAMAAGTPVIAYGDGGAGETVIPGVTGVLFNHQNWEALLDAVLNFQANDWDRGKLRAQAEKFSSANFKEKFSRYVNDAYEEFKRGLNQCQLPVTFTTPAHTPTTPTQML